LRLEERSFEGSRWKSRGTPGRIPKRDKEVPQTLTCKHIFFSFSYFNHFQIWHQPGESSISMNLSPALKNANGNCIA
jgi:hypothetical protein